MATICLAVFWRHLLDFGVISSMYYKLSISVVKAQIIAKITFVAVKDEGLKISNQLRNLSRSEQTEKYNGLKITNFGSYF